MVVMMVVIMVDLGDTQWIQSNVIRLEDSQTLDYSNGDKVMGSGKSLDTVGEGVMHDNTSSLSYEHIPSTEPNTKVVKIESTEHSTRVVKLESAESGVTDVKLSITNDNTSTTSSSPSNSTIVSTSSSTNYSIASTDSSVKTSSLVDSRF